MVLLIDANIILDVLLKRLEFYEDSSKVWKMCETHTVKGYISTLTWANIVYVMRKELDSTQIKDVLAKLLIIFEFKELDVNILVQASELKWSDYEDAIQYCTARKVKANYIVTRNVKGFNKSDVMALTPTELLKRL